MYTDLEIGSVFPRVAIYKRSVMDSTPRPRTGPRVAIYTAPRYARDLYIAPPSLLLFFEAFVLRGWAHFRLIGFLGNNIMFYVGAGGRVKNV